MHNPSFWKFRIIYKSEKITILRNFIENWICFVFALYTVIVHPCYDNWH